MKIIIIGAGKIGYNLAKHLSSEDNDVIIIDKDQKALAKVEDSLDVMPIKGNGIRTSTLLDAGCKGIDLIIAVTGSDEVNMLCCLTAKKLGALRSIARIRDPQYAKELLLIKEDLGLDMVINPEQVAAHEITRILTMPGATKVSTFAQGRVGMVGLTIKKNTPIAGLKIKQIVEKFNVPILIGVIIREGNVIIPNGDFEVEVNDSIYAIGHLATLYNFCKHVQDKGNRVKRVLVVGGGKITYYLAELLHELNIKVKVIEKDEATCLNLAEELPDTLIINGDGTDSTLLLQEHIESVDSFIALTNRDEENIISSLIAKQHKVDSVITKISRSNCRSVIEGIGIDTVISPQEFTTDHILKYVRGNTVETLQRIMDGQGEVIEFIATANDHLLLDTPIHKLNLLSNVLIAAVVRKNRVVILNGNDRLYEGDRVLIITTRNITRLKDIIHHTAGGFKSELKNNLKKLGNAINM
nr:Trk system potassium transporter TrkA [uncultured Niameybacter sp.]